MTGDWRKLALAAATAIALGATSAPPGVAQAQGQAQTPSQAPGKAGAKKAPAKDADGEAGDGAAKPKRQDPAEAERTIAAASQQLEAGKSAEAAQALTRVLSGGGLPPAMMAKALFYRGVAYRQQKKPAQAIADLTSALWLKGGLAEADRADALKQRTAAYQEAAPSPPPSSSGWPNPFAGWFGGAPTAPPSPPRQEPTTTASIETAPQVHVPPPATSPSGAKTSAWTSQTDARGSSSGPARESAATPKPEGRFRIQIGMMRTEAEAQALSTRVKREHPDALGAREAEIDEAVVGNMGSFYRVRVGPFASAQEGQAACAKLKGAGIDCLLVTP